MSCVRTALTHACVLAGMLLLIIVPLSAQPRASAQRAVSLYVPGEVLVQYRPGVPPRRAQIIENGVGAVQVGAFAHAGLAHLRLPPALSVEAAVRRLQADPAVAYAQPNYLYHADGVPNDPQFGSLWGLNNTGQSGGTADADVDAPEAGDLSTGSSGVVVAVIDTGVDYTHPDLAANIWSNPGEIAGNGIDDDGNGYVDDVHGYDFHNNDPDPMDDHNHGTHVAGTIGAVGDNGSGVVGVNWNVRIIACKFLDSSGSGDTANAIRALDYVLALKGAGVNVVATNNSWGGTPYDQALKDAIDRNGAAGILFVAAAGNGNIFGFAVNTDTSPHYPSSYSSANIISVAATDRNDLKASWSNYGATSVDLGAPGVDILSTTRNSTYSTFSGTSMATPHVTGAAALLAGYVPGLTAADIKARILSTGDPNASLSGKTVSGRRLNLHGLLGGGGVTPPPEPPPALAVTVRSEDALGTPTSSFKLGQTVYIRIGVADASGPVGGAAVHLEIRTPSGRTYIGDGSTGILGYVRFTYKSSRRDGAGTHTATATASAGGAVGTGSTTYTMRK